MTIVKEKGREMVYYWGGKKARLFAGALDRLQDGELNQVTIVLHGCEIVFVPDAIEGVRCFISDTSGG
jgi:hypothetical protein